MYNGAILFITSDKRHPVGSGKLLTYGMNIVDIIEKDDVSLCVRIEFSESRCALLKIHRSCFKDVHQGQPFRGAEASAAIVHNAVGSDMLSSYLVHTTTAQKKTANITHLLTNKTFNIQTFNLHPVV